MTLEDLPEGQVASELCTNLRSVLGELEQHLTTNLQSLSTRLDELEDRLDRRIAVVEQHQVHSDTDSWGSLSRSARILRAWPESGMMWPSTYRQQEVVSDQHDPVFHVLHWQGYTGPQVRDLLHLYPHRAGVRPTRGSGPGRSHCLGWARDRGLCRGGPLELQLPACQSTHPARLAEKGILPWGARSPGADTAMPAAAGGAHPATCCGRRPVGTPGPGPMRPSGGTPPTLPY